MKGYKTFQMLAFWLLLQMPCRWACAEPLALSVKAEAAILMNAESGAILYAKNPHDLHYPASITKIATALYVLEQAGGSLDEQIEVDADCIGVVTEEAIRRSRYTLPPYLLIPDASNIGLKKGEKLSLRDLLYGMMLSSGDDAANVLAKHVGGTIEAFMERLNLYIQGLGLAGTRFVNPHGLHHPDQKTTAYEMAMLTRAALKNPDFLKIASTVRHPRPKTAKQAASTFLQTNRLLRPGPYFYDKAIGVKTGYYSLAGSTFVAAAVQGERTLIAVLLKVKDRKDIFLDAKMMFEAAFSQPKVRRLYFKGGPQEFSLELPGAQGAMTTEAREDLYVEYYPAEEPKVRCLLCWLPGLALPIEKGQHVGDILLRDDEGSDMKRMPLYAAAAVLPTFYHQWLSFQQERPLLIAVAQGILVMLMLGGMGALYFFWLKGK